MSSVNLTILLMLSLPLLPPPFASKIDHNFTIRTPIWRTIAPFKPLYWTAYYVLLNMPLHAIWKCCPFLLYPHCRQNRLQLCHSYPDLTDDYTVDILGPNYPIPALERVRCLHLGKCCPLLTLPHTPSPSYPRKPATSSPFLLRSAEQLHRCIPRTGLPYTCPRTGVLRLPWICCPLLTLPPYTLTPLPSTIRYLFPISAPILPTIAPLEFAFITHPTLLNVHATCNMGMSTPSPCPLPLLPVKTRL